jgi:hypothetical protein
MTTRTESNILSQLINSNTWQVTIDIQKSLTDIANQPLTASVESKEHLHQQFIDVLYCGALDEIHGGLILGNDLNLLSTSANNEYFFKPLEINLALCRLFYSAGQVFYDGVLVTVADKILVHLSQSSQHEELRLERKDEHFYSHSDLECLFTEDEIEKLLTAKEKELFEAICSNKTGQNKFIYSRIHSLKDASENINMHFKEAQIVEYAIHSKLLKYSTSKPKMKSNLECIDHKSSFSNSNNKLLNKIFQTDWFDNTCTLIEVIIENRSSSQEQVRFARNIYELLEHHIHEQQDLIYPHYLSLISAGINLLIVDFDLIFLSRIFKLIEHAFILRSVKSQKNEHRSTDRNNYQESFISNFLNSLRTKSLVNITLHSSQISIINKMKKLSTKNNYSENFRFVFIDKSNIDHEQLVTSFHSKYNTFQKLFSI